MAIRFAESGNILISIAANINAKPIPCQLTLNRAFYTIMTQIQAN
jgi:hypothetical protein